MKYFNYKIQWVFNIGNYFLTPKEQLRKELYNVIRALGARSLTVINFLDDDFKKIDSYTGMMMYSYDKSNKETIKYIQKQLKENSKIKMVELIRRD